LLERKLHIVGEILLDVAHCLVAPTESLSDVARVYSHPQALAQCRGWLARNVPSAQLVVSPSTAAAAREARDDGAGGAVASRLAAELSGLNVLAERIQDRPINVTRFVLLGQRPAAPSGRDKTSIAFSLKHEHGALRRALSELERAGLNLTRIESRPSRERIWEYVFLSDFEGHRDDPAIAGAIAGLADQCGFVRVLGSYPQAVRS
jgi:chorismate mutase/prephenate dehydratase